MEEVTTTITINRYEYAEYINLMDKRNILKRMLYRLLKSGKCIDIALLLDLFGIPEPESEED